MGYEIQVHPANQLLVHNVPYVTPGRTVSYGMLIIPIVEIHDDVAGAPQNHQAYFQGEFPCNTSGTPLTVMGQPVHGALKLAAGLEAQFHFSYKSPKVSPATGKYVDYYDLVTEYIDEMWKYARRVDPSATPLTHRVDDIEDEPSVFVYRDTASTRAEITQVTAKLKGHVVAIIGLGGTGSYVLDLLAKTPLKEIRLYDGDLFSQHNAFRAPGAAPKEDVFAQPPLSKVEYFRRKYSEMHRGIVAQPIYVEVVGAEFRDVDFIFVCIDKATAKRPIVDSLVALNKPFIDVGMGMILEGDTLGGTVRTTFSAPGHREHRHGISFVDVDDVYALNIQIADLNALNAALAVIRWKKHLGFYRVANAEYSSVYTVEFNRIDNAEPQ